MQVSGSGGAAQAAQTQQWRDRMFQRADSDRSGRLSLAEFGQLATRGRAANPAASPADPARAAAGNQPGSAIAETFNRLDSDGDGSLSRTELEVRLSVSPSQRGGGFDAATFAALLGTQGRDTTPGQGRIAVGRHQRDHDADRGGLTEASRLAQLAAYQARQTPAAITANALATGTARGA